MGHPYHSASEDDFLEEQDEETELYKNRNFMKTKSNSIVIPSILDGKEDTDLEYLRFIRDRSVTSSSASLKKSRRSVVLPSLGDSFRHTDINGKTRTVLDESDLRKCGSAGDGDYSTLTDGIAGLGRENKSITVFTNLSGLGHWSEDEGEEEDVDEDKIPETRTVEVLVKYNGSSEQCRDKQKSLEITVDIPRPYSITSSATASRETLTISPDGYSSRVNVDKWCSCLYIDPNLVECRECCMTGGHELWCISRAGICGDCGKPVEVGGSFIKSPSKIRPSLTSSSHNSATCSGKHRTTVERTEDLTPTLKTEKKKKKSKKVDTGTNQLTAAEATERGRSRASTRRRIRSGTNPSATPIDPNIHRQAYLLALADAGFKKWKKDPWMHYTNNRRYFSYFPAWKNPRSEEEDVPKIGIRGDDRKLKIKDGMKHIFGPVKVSDYYPTGKRFPKIREEPFQL
ncbi:uncharacterized protein [Haliotis asinina]|uniref:uncharacterized protein n=1 Tax=Haliotis asinina TaxID=109174 RepID=UPI0035324B65